MTAQSEQPGPVVRCTSCGREFNLNEEPPAPPESSERDRLADIDVPNIARRWVKVIDRKASPRPSRGTINLRWFWTCLFSIGFLVAFPAFLEGDWGEGINRLIGFACFGSVIQTLAVLFFSRSFEPPHEPTVAEEIERLKAEDPSLAQSINAASSSTAHPGVVSARADAIQAESNPVQLPDNEDEGQMRIQRRDQLTIEEPGSSSTSI
jgi:hypothetical protein